MPRSPLPAAPRRANPRARSRRLGCRARRTHAAGRPCAAAAAPRPPPHRRACRPLPDPRVPRPRRARPASVRSLSTLQRLVLQVLVMKLVAELVTFRRQIASVLRPRVGLDRHLLDDLEAEPFDPGDLLRVVRQDPDRRQTEVGQDLVADPVVPHVRLEAELDVRLDRVEPVLLELVRAQLVEQSDAASLLRHVEEHAALLGCDPTQRVLELLAAVAAQRVEDVPGQTLRVDAYEHVLLPLDIALDER